METHTHARLQKDGRKVFARKLRANLFNPWYNAIISVVLLLALAKAIAFLFKWAIVDATWIGSSSQSCHLSGGACWAFIAEKSRFILFGTYPFDEQWRPGLVLLAIAGIILLTGNPRFWKPWLLWVWALLVSLAIVVMGGGVAGLPVVPTQQWGGLPLTILLVVIAMFFAFPLGVLLALGRRSKLFAVKTLSIAYIELIRGIPLITVLFVALILFPLFLPAGVSVNELIRIQVGLILFEAAYVAEVVRGGLQSIPRGQYESAAALGMSKPQSLLYIVLPQALKISIPPLANTFIVLCKNTSLVAIVGMFDLLGTAKAALNDPNWRGHYFEAYLFISLIYFVICFGISSYASRLERRGA